MGQSVNTRVYVMWVSGIWEEIYADVYMEEGCGPTSVCMAVTCTVDVTLLCVLCLPGSHCPLVGLADT